MAAQVTERWDIASTVAVTCVYPQAQFEQMISAIADLISPGGYYIGWEMIHGVDQELEIKETHADISDILCIRSTKKMFQPSSRVRDFLRSGFCRLRCHSTWNQ